MQDSKIGIRRKIEKELARLAGMGAILKGTVSKVNLGRRKAGAGNRTSFLLTYKDKENKTRTIYLGKKRVADAKKMIANHRKLKCVLEKIVGLNIRMFKLKQ